MTGDHENLPAMSEAVLDDVELMKLFRDLRACAKIEEIIVKTGPGHADDQVQVTLDEVEQLLIDRSVRGVQVRYRFEEALWMDTLMPKAEGVRLVRIRHEAV